MTLRETFESIMGFPHYEDYTVYVEWLEQQITNFQDMINDLPENRPLYRDSGLWQVRSDDMEEVLYQQESDETFLQFINRVYIGSL